MKPIALLAIAISLASCSDKTTTPSPNQTGQINSPPQTSSQTSAKSSAYRIGPHSLEISFDEFMSHFTYDSTEVIEGMLWVKKGEQTLFGLSDKNDLQEKKVRMIELYSPDIQTESGVHVGMTIKQLQQLFPDIELDYYEESNEEAFLIPLSGTQLPPKQGDDVYVAAFVESKVNKELTKHPLKDLKNGDPWPYPTKDYSTEGSISRILLFK